MLIQHARQQPEVTTKAQAKKLLLGKPIRDVIPPCVAKMYTRSGAMSYLLETAKAILKNGFKRYAVAVQLRLLAMMLAVVTVYLRGESKLC